MINRATNRRLCRELPHPLALSWRRFLLARNEAAKVVQLKGCLDVLLRLMSAYLLADYLRREPVAAVEQEIARLDRPSLGTYRALVREILRTARGNEEAFFAKAAAWHFKRNGRPTKSAHALDRLVELRNDDAHGHAKTEAALRPYREEFEQHLRSLLSEASWLTEFRMFHVQDVKPARAGGNFGSIQWFVGDSTEPIPEPASWSARTFPGALYLCNGEGSRFLELDPFVQLSTHESTRRLFLFVDIHRDGSVRLRLDSAGIEQRRKPQLLDADVPWAEYLSERGSLEQAVDNERINDFAIQDADQYQADFFGDQYRFIEKIGEGGMAEVFAVEDLKDGGTWALKVIRSELMDRGKERFQREMKLMYAIDHPHILSVDLVAFLTDGRCAIRMEWMEEGTLKDLLENRLCSPEEVARWAGQLLSALVYLEENDIIHRDIKPSNILLSDDGSVKLSDFGIARRDGDVRLTRTEEQVGSWPYMAPELRLDKASPSLESDLYSLAVTLHELLTGELSDEPGKGISGDLGKLIRVLASKQPENRREALGKSLNPGVHSSQPMERTARQTGQARGGGKLKWAFGCLGLFIIVCVGPCIPLPSDDSDEVDWAETYLEPLAEAYKAKELDESGLGERLAVLRKDIMAADLNPPPNDCYQDLVLDTLGDLRSQDGNRLGSLEESDGTPRRTPLVTPVGELPLARSAIQSEEEANKTIIQTMSNYRKIADEWVDEADSAERSLIAELMYPFFKNLLLDSIIDQMMRDREAGFRKTLTMEGLESHKVQAFLEAVESDRTLEEADRKYEKGFPLDVQGILTTCEGNFFILSSSEMGGGRAGVKLEFLPRQMEAMWDSRVGDSIHARCVIESTGEPPYWLSSCIRLANAP